MKNEILINDSVSIISLILSALSFIVAVLSSRQTNKNSRESNCIARNNAKLQERIVALEEAREEDRKNQSKAKLVLSVRRKPVLLSSSITIQERFLRIENNGLAEARKVNVLIDGQPLVGHPSISHLSSETNYGQNCIAAQSYIEYQVRRELFERDKKKVSVSWEDDISPGSITATLDF